MLMLCVTEVVANPVVSHGMNKEPHVVVVFVLKVAKAESAIVPQAHQDIVVLQETDFVLPKRTTTTAELFVTTVQACGKPLHTVDQPIVQEDSVE
jgi:hypothetical protein